MTLILTRTSARYALMLTDRKVTRDGVEFDSDANKNVLFGDRNCVAAVAYTGMAYIGTIPTDQWIAQTLTGLSFPEGRRGRGSVPMLMTTQYPRQYLGLRIRDLRDRLKEARSVIFKQYRNAWTANSFDIVITGFEWNHGEARPVLIGLSKPAGSEDVELLEPARQWYLPRDGRFPVRMTAAPSQNLTIDELGRIEADLQSTSRNGEATPGQVAKRAESLFAQTIQQASNKHNVVGPDVMSILIPGPVGPNPTIRVRYITVTRDRGLIVAGNKRLPVRVAFSPWILTPGCIRSPSVFTNAMIEAPCGPYTVVMEGPGAGGTPFGMSSQERREIE
jgi:hypothetical protein